MNRVVIVGSGPAGMSAAYFLSEKFNVTVLERLSDDHYQRYHQICGGGISKAAFRESGLPISGIINEVKETHITWPDGTDVKMRTRGYIIDRNVFLSDLRKRCAANGVRFINGSVTDVTVSDHYSVKTTTDETYQCDWIIGADGSSSIVRKKLFGTMPRETIPTTEYVIDRKSSDKLIIHLKDHLNGTYFWEFPRGDKTGTGGMNDKYLETEFVSKGSRNIPIGGVGKIVKNHAFLVGDAAAMANPVSYGGLRSALISGKKAANAIVKGNPNSYEKWWSSSILSDEKFMKFHEKLKNWTEEDMIRAVRPFKHGGIFLPGIIACITQPKNINMYFGCLFAFTHGW